MKRASQLFSAFFDLLWCKCSYGLALQEIILNINDIGILVHTWKVTNSFQAFFKALICLRYKLPLFNRHSQCQKFSFHD